MKQALTANGYDVVLADSGKRGIRLAQTELPDLVLSDVNMENGDGYDLLAALRDHRATARIPFILMTTEPSSGGLLQGLSLSVDDYLPKPFTVSELLAAISNCLNPK